MRHESQRGGAGYSFGEHGEERKRAANEPIAGGRCRLAAPGVPALKLLSAIVAHPLHRPSQDVIPGDQPLEVLPVNLQQLDVAGRSRRGAWAAVLAECFALA